MKQLPQPGDIVALRGSERFDVVELPGAVLVARRDEPTQSEATDLSNVVPFARPRRQSAAPAFPLPSIAADERPAPQAATLGIGRNTAIIAVSLVLHGGLLVTLWQTPRSMASIGIEVMTLEISLGATTPLGVAETPTWEETQLPRSDERLGDGIEVQERSLAMTVMPQDVPVAMQETSPDVAQQEMQPEAQAVEPVPAEQRPESTTAETPVPTQPGPKVQAVQGPERKRIAGPTEKKPPQKKQAANTVRANPSRGVGIGSSDNSSNYNGIVRAHVLRYKQYPASARSSGAQGVATVTFSLDGSGRVTSARLAGSSGNAAIDQEVVAMARRASPFPPPPDGKGRNFTVPVNFNLR